MKTTEKKKRQNGVFISRDDRCLFKLILEKFHIGLIVFSSLLILGLIMWLLICARNEKLKK